MYEERSREDLTGELQLSPAGETRRWCGSHLRSLLIRKEDPGVLTSHTVFFSHWLRLGNFFPSCFLCFGEGDQNRMLAFECGPLNREASVISKSLQDGGMH